MRNDVETFEEELNPIISICDEKIKRYRALLDEYQERLRKLHGEKVKVIVVKESE